MCLGAAAIGNMISILSQMHFLTLVWALPATLPTGRNCGMRLPWMRGKSIAMVALPGEHELRLSPKQPDQKPHLVP